MLTQSLLVFPLRRSGWVSRCGVPKMSCQFEIPLLSIVCKRLAFVGFQFNFNLQLTKIYTTLYWQLTNEQTANWQLTNSHSFHWQLTQKFTQNCTDNWRKGKQLTDKWQPEWQLMLGTHHLDSLFLPPIPSLYWVTSVRLGMDQDIWRDWSILPLHFFFLFSANSCVRFCFRHCTNIFWLFGLLKLCWNMFVLVIFQPPPPPIKYQMVHPLKQCTALSLLLI